MLRLLLALLVCGLAGLSAQEAGPAPADGIRDDTRALGADAHAALAAEMTAFRGRHGVDVWLVAETFQLQAGSLRDRARLLRQGWSGAGDAVLILYDRSTDKEYTSISPGLWRQLPTAGLYQLHTSVHEVMADRKRPAEARLLEVTKNVIKGLASLKSREAAASVVRTRDYYRMAGAYAAALSAGAVAAWLAGLFVRRRDVHAAHQVSLPRLAVSPRLGAPHGAGVISSAEG